MNIGSINGGYSPYAQTVQRQPEAAEAKTAGRDNDGDADDGGAKALQAPAATVNTSGQTVGQIISTSA